MMSSFRIHAALFEDVLTYASHLQVESPAIADRFRSAVDQSLEMIRLFPEAWAYHQACLPQARGLRKRRIPGFPNYFILYRTLHKGEVEVLHVVHTARDLPSLIEDEGL
jgi:plasmid stabilization system protein ParE